MAYEVGLAETDEQKEAVYHFRYSLYGIADSPVGLAAWLLDHNDADGQPAAAVASALERTTSATGELTRDESSTTSRSTG